MGGREGPQQGAGLDIIREGYPKVTHARVAKMLEGVPDGELEALFTRCSAYRKFGAGLGDQLAKRV